MKKKTVIMNFSGIYEEEIFYKDREVCWINCRDISGVNGYCSDDAQEEIRKRIWDYDYRGIHFLDSGNYHYLSKFWLEKIEEPYSLIVFDHHTDMQESAFFGMLSCGSWIKEVLEEHPYIQEVCVVGPPKAATEQCEPNLVSRVVFLTQEELEAGTLEKWQEFLENGKELPVYLSIDKDVLCLEDARTNWDQGEMKLEEMEKMIKQVFQKRNVLGADICGENPQDTARMPAKEDLEINGRTNARLCHCIK
ncbi:MAG: arginase family protein [Blautia sp.]|nr:arginase family protein [Blautia sp.]